MAQKTVAMTIAAAAAVFAAALAACASSSLAPTGMGATPTPFGATPTPGPTPPMALTVPTGFRVSMVSTNVSGARFMAVAPNGDLLVSETNNGQVVAIAPGQSVSAAPHVVASNLERPHGLAFKGSDLYIATWTGFSVIRNYPTGTTVQPLYTDLTRNGVHNNRSLAIAPDSTVFESSGSDCNLCAESDPKLATIMHVNVDGTKPQIYASGVRNGSGLAFDHSGQLWMVVNQRDNLTPNHQDLPPDEFDMVVANGDYGWPSCYPDLTGARQPSPDSPVPNPNCAGQVKTTLPLQAHSAPLGITFYDATMFPLPYRGGAFVAFHGSWDRDVKTGYKVVFVTFQNGQPVSYADFITGWLANSNVSGRPVGLAVAADGSLYISDDLNGYVYRVTYSP